MAFDNYSQAMDLLGTVADRESAGEKIFSQVWKIIDRAESFEDMERDLATLMGGDMGPDAMGDLLADLMVEANLMGRFAEAEKRRGNA